MKTLSLTNRRILVVFLLVGLMIIKSTLLEKTKEGFECVLNSDGDPCSFKNSNNYSEEYKNAKLFIKDGYRKEMINSRNLISEGWNSETGFLRLRGGLSGVIYSLQDKIFIFLRYILANITIIKSMFIPSTKYKLKCFYACKNNIKKCENNTKFLNYSIIKMFIKAFNSLGLNNVFTGIKTPSRDDLFEKCTGIGSKNYAECCSYISNESAFFQLIFFAFLGLMFLIFLLIFLYLFLKKI